MKKRFENSDLIIYLDFSTLAQLKGILGRFLKNPGKEKPEIPGCKEQMTLKFFIFVCKWRKTKRNFVLENLNLVDKDKILIFKNRRQLNNWYKNEFGQKIIT